MAPGVVEFDVFVIDPPWPYHAGGKKKSRPRTFDDAWGYDTMPTPEIFELLDRELFVRAAPVHTVFLWSLERSLLEGEREMEQRGYKRHVRMIWDKGNGHAPAFTIQYAHEYLTWWYKPTLTPVDLTQRGKYKSVFQARSRQHSRKPDLPYLMIDCWYPVACKVDVFSRETRPGWWSWGNEVGKFSHGSDYI